MIFEDIRHMVVSWYAHIMVALECSSGIWNMELHCSPVTQILLVETRPGRVYGLALDGMLHNLANRKQILQRSM